MAHMDKLQFYSSIFYLILVKLDSLTANCQDGFAK